MGYVPGMKLDFFLGLKIKMYVWFSKTTLIGIFTCGSNVFDEWWIQFYHSIVVSFLYAGELVMFPDIMTIDRRVANIYPEVSEDELKLWSNEVTRHATLVTVNYEGY